MLSFINFWQQSSAIVNAAFISQGEVQARLRDLSRIVQLARIIRYRNPDLLESRVLPFLVFCPTSPRSLPAPSCAIQQRSASQLTSGSHQHPHGGDAVPKGNSIRNHRIKCFQSHRVQSQPCGQKHSVFRVPISFSFLLFLSRVLSTFPN